MDPDAIDREALGRTRLACHAMAEHVLAAALYADTGHIGLTFNGIGIATPEFRHQSANQADDQPSDQDRITFDGFGLIIERDGMSTYATTPTIGAAAEALGITPGAPADVYRPSTVLEPDRLLATDPTAIIVLWTWFLVGQVGLRTIRDEAAAEDAASALVLWPEHFDLAIELGEETRGSRGTFGASTGDAEHELPYLYVTHWADAPDDPRWIDPFWNDAAFTGASLPMTAVSGATDPPACALEFYRTARTIMRGRGTD